MPSFGDSMNSVLGLTQYVGDQYQQGVERKRKNSLADLMGQAASGGAVDAQGIARNGGDPFAVQGQVDKQRQAALQSAGQIAAIVASAPPERRAQVYASVLPKLAPISQQLGLPLPPAWDESHLAEVQQIAQTYGGMSGQEYKPMNVSPGGAVIDPRTGKVIYQNQNFAPKAPMNPVWDSARGGWVMPPDMSGAPMGTPQAPQAGATGDYGSPVGDFLTDATQVASAHGFEITDGLRTPEQNAATPGSAANSAHMSGNGIDLRVRDKTPEQIAAITQEMQARGYHGGYTTRGTAPHLHFEKRGGAPQGRPGFIPVVAPKEDKPALADFEKRAAYLRAQGVPEDQITRMVQGGPNASGSGKPLPAPVVAKLTKQAGIYDNTQSLIAGFKDDYAGNVVTGGLENTAGRLGLPGATPGQADWWQQYDRQKNEVRNLLFGSALTPSEQAAFEQADIQPNMAPARIRTNLKMQADIVRRGLDRQGKVWKAQGFNTEAIDMAISPMESDAPGGVDPARQALLDKY